MSDPAFEEPVIRDKRRLDPQTGKLRENPVGAAAPAGAAPAGAPAASSAFGATSTAEALERETAEDTAGTDERVAALQAQLAERTADLQRIQADFVNFRRRVERDRLAVAEQALGSVLVGLLPVLDDISRARAHGEVEGGFKLVADGLETTLTKLGLTPYGEKGEAFDPTVHEALTHTHSAEVAGPTCVEVLQPGYRLGDRVLRPARVAVAEPE